MSWLVYVAAALWGLGMLARAPRRRFGLKSRPLGPRPAPPKPQGRAVQSFEVRHV